MNSKSALKAIARRIKENIKESNPSNETLTIDEAATEIANALKIKSEAATMTLYGLCATGNVRWLNDQGEVIEEDECTIGDFEGKPKSVIAIDVRSFLTDWSPDPQPSRREAVIGALIAEGVNPPRNISWKEFYKRVRDACNARLDAKGRAPLGFGDKQIQRIVKDLRVK
jgi:hypothetical protein